MGVYSSQDCEPLHPLPPIEVVNAAKFQLTYRMLTGYNEAVYQKSGVPSFLQNMMSMFPEELVKYGMFSMRSIEPRDAYVGFSVEGNHAVTCSGLLVKTLNEEGFKDIRVVQGDDFIDVITNSVTTHFYRHCYGSMMQTVASTLDYRRLCIITPDNHATTLIEFRILAGLPAEPVRRFPSLFRKTAQLNPYTRHGPVPVEYKRVWLIIYAFRHSPVVSVLPLCLLKELCLLLMEIQVNDAISLMLRYIETKR